MLAQESSGLCLAVVLLMRDVSRRRPFLGVPMRTRMSIQLWYISPSPNPGCIRDYIAEHYRAE